MLETVWSKGMQRNTALIALWGLGALATAGAEAADHRFYAGVAIGQASVDGPARTGSSIILAPPFQSPGSVPIEGLGFDDKTTSWSAFMGYHATQYVGLEIGYWDHGTFDSKFTGPDPGTLSIKEEYFGATLRYPFGRRFALTGSAGISRAQFDVKGSIDLLVIGPPVFPPVVPLPGPIQNLPLATPDDETGGYWNVGLNWRVTDAIEAGVSYGKRDLQVQQVKSLALSVMYAF
jgi:hypothetical protein